MGRGCTDRILFGGLPRQGGVAQIGYPIRIPFWGAAQMGWDCADGVPFTMLFRIHLKATPRCCVSKALKEKIVDGMRIFVCCHAIHLS